MAFVDQLKTQLEAHRNPEFALQMQAYMKHLFPFLGIKAPLRKTVLKTVSNSEKGDILANCRGIVKDLFQYDEREFQYCAMETGAKFLKRKYDRSDYIFITKLITTKSPG